jgi:hypothetical protein
MLPVVNLNKKNLTDFRHKLYSRKKLLSDTLASQQQLTRVQINIGLSRGYLISRSTGKSSELPELDVRKWPLEWPRGLGGGWYTELARTNFIQN